jgi:hypothetical protein
MNSQQRRRRHFIEGLRAIAKFYEETPEAYYDGMHITLNMYVWGGAARQTLAQTARAVGQCNKVYDESNVTVSRPFRIWLYPLPPLVAIVGFLYILFSRPHFAREIFFAMVVVLTGTATYTVRAYRRREWPFVPLRAS